MSRWEEATSDAGLSAKMDDVPLSIRCFGLFLSRYQNFKKVKRSEQIKKK